MLGRPGRQAQPTQLGWWRGHSKSRDGGENERRLDGAEEFSFQESRCTCGGMAYGALGKTDGELGRSKDAWLIRFIAGSTEAAPGSE